MNALQRALIEKAGHDFGFEHVFEQATDFVALASALHGLRARITSSERGLEVELQRASGTLQTELLRDFFADQSRFLVPDTNALALLLKRASGLACSLPNQAQSNYEAEVTQTLDQLPAQILVCGGRRMAADVALAMEAIMAQMSLSVAALRLAGRYLEDTY